MRRAVSLALVLALLPPISAPANTAIPQPDMRLVSIGAGLLLGLASDECREPESIDTVLMLVPQSLYFTQREVIRPWEYEYLGYLGPKGDYDRYPVYDSLGDVDKYVEVKRALDRQLLLCLPEPYGRLLIATKSVFQLTWLNEDNHFRSVIGLSPVIGISYEWWF